MSATGDPSDIRNWRRRPDGITTSGRLEPDDPVRLATAGVKHVINLALDDHPEALANERELLAQEGIGYTHIPVPFDAPSMEHLSRLRYALDKAQSPVHVHCIMNWRVTAFFYLIDCMNGVPENLARARMVEVWNPFNAEDPRAEPWRKLLEGQTKASLD